MRRDIAADAKRISIDAPGMRGTISTVGARIDDAILTKLSGNAGQRQRQHSPAEAGWRAEILLR